MLDSRFVWLTSFGIIVISSACCYLLIGGWSGALLALSLFLTLSTIMVRASSSISAINSQTEVKLPRITARRELICIAVMYVLGLAVLFLVAPLQGKLYVPPTELSIAVWFRHFAAIFFTTFLPGYMLLRILDPGRHMRTLEVVALSFVLSVFLTFLVGYLALQLGQQIEQVSVYGVSLLNSLLLVVFALRSQRRFEISDHQVAVRNVKRIELWYILFFIGIVGLTVFFTYGLIGTQIIGDQRNIHGLVLVMENTRLPQDSVAFPSYPWLVVTYMATTFASSGLPSVNAYNSLNVLDVFSVLSFFIMVRWLFRKRPNNDLVAAVSTFLAFFTSGFGWLAVAGSTISGASGSLSQQIYQAWTQTYDILTSNSFVTGGHPDVTTSLLLVAMPAMFLAFGLAVSDIEGISIRLRVSLLALLIMIGYVAHPETVVILIPILVVSLFLKKGLWNLLSGVLGLTGIVALDLSSPSHFYLSTYISLLGFRAPLLVFLFLGFVIALGLSLWIRSARSLLLTLFEALSKIGKLMKAIFGRGPIRLARAALFAVIYLYLLVFVFWFLQQSSVVVPYYFSLDGSVPWYFYPIRLGIPGLVVILGTVYLLVAGQFKAIKLLAPLFSWMLITLLSSPFALEYRLVKELYLPITIASGFVLVMLIGDQHQTAQVVKTGNPRLSKIPKLGSAVLLTFVLILASIGSPLLYAYAEQRQDNNEVAGILPRRAPLTAGEFEALDWIRNNTESGTLPVIALSSYLGNDIVDLAGVQSVLANRYVPFFQVNDPANLFDLIGTIQPHYIYLSQEDLQVLQAEGYQNNLAVQLTKYLPIAFNNSEATVYEVPPMVGPSLESSVAVSVPSSMFSLAMLGLAGVNYTIFGKDDPSLFNHGTIILSGYPTDDLVQYENWANGGGHLVILGFPLDPSLSTVYDASNGTYFGLSPSSHWYLSDNNSLEADDATIVTKENYSGQYMVETVAKVVQIDNPSDNHLGLVFGFENSDSYYYAFLRQGALVLFKEQKGIGREVFSVPIQRLEGTYYDLAVKVTPPTISFYLDGQLMGQYSDPQFLGGGFVGFSTHNLISDFEKLVVQYLPTYDLPVDSISTENLELSLPELYVPHFNQTASPSGNLTVTSYYELNGKQVEPFSMSSTFGAGDITYINFEPLTNFLSGTGAQPAQRSLFVELGNLLHTAVPALPYISQPALNISEAIPYAEGQVNCTGSALAETDSIIFNSPASPTVQIDLSKSVVANVTFNNTDVLLGTQKLQGELLTYSESGEVRTSLDAPWLVISNTYGGVYPQIDVPLESHWSSVISSNSTLHLTLLVDDNPVSVLVTGGTVEGNFVNSSEGGNNSDFTNYAVLYMRYPSLMLQGQIYIENAFLSTGPNQVIVLGKSVMISGSMSFSILNVDSTIIRIANLSLSGSISLVQIQSARLPTIPWIEVLTSPYNIAFNAAFLLCIAVYIVKKRNAKSETAVHKDTARHPLVPKSAQTYPLMIANEKTYLLMVSARCQSRHRNA